jgi:PAS domain-containing protein
MTTRRWLTRYGVAALTIVPAMAFMALVPGVPRWPGTAALVCLFAVLLSAWYGGFGPGLLTTALVATLTLTPDFPLWKQVRLLVFIAEGALISSLLGSLHTARRRAEESERWLAAVLSSIGDAVIAADARGRVCFINPVARELTGWGQDVAAGKPLGEIFRVVSETDHQPVENPGARAIREGVVLGPAD